MKTTCKSFLPLSAAFAAALSLLPAFADAQIRAFDNFDRTQGVQIHNPPAPPVVEVPKPATRRVRRNGRWVNVPVNPPASQTQRTASVQPRGADVAYPATRLAMGTGNSLKGFTTGNPLHDKYIEDSSKKYRIDPLLIYAQMHQESAFKLRATSHKGASGLMQLMPATARRFGVTSIYDPKQNVEAGVRYMRWLLDFFNQDVVLALAGYNAGEGAVLRYGRQVPPFRETREYVRRISARYNNISNPQYVTTSVAASGLKQTAQVEQKSSRPLTVFEPPTLSVTLADGRKMLINQ